MDEEIWKPCFGHERYQISTWGRIRFGTRERVRKLKVHYTHHRKPYLVFTCRVNKTQHRNFKVGRLVLLTFVGPAPPDKPLCCHNDDDGFNNRLDNLKWGCHAENQAERANPLCENCTKKCRQDTHEPESGQCMTPYCECTGWKKKVKSLFVWGKSLEKTT